MPFRGTFSALSINGFQSVSGIPAWILKQTITFANDVTGIIQSTAFSADGNYLAISTNYDNNGTGAVYIYYNGGSGTSWVLQQTIIGTATNQRFGESLSLSDDGSYIAIGAPGQTLAIGAIHIYTRSGTTWTLQQQIVASDGQISDNFGSEVSLSGTANYVAVGAPSEDTSPFTNNGAAYIFIRSGTTWTEQQKLLAPLPTRESQANFGSSLQISQNGSYVIIGAAGAGGTTDTGIAYIFLRTGTTWAAHTILYGSGIGIGAAFGATVNIDNTGSLACIREPGQGLLYFYTRSGSTWTLIQTVDYGDYLTLVPNNSTTEGTALQGTGKNLILGLYVNDQALALSNDSSVYQIEQQLFTGGTPPPEYGARVSIARTANVCAVTTISSVGSPNSVFIYTKD